MTDWLALWSVGRFDLGLKEEEFWALSPQEFNALYKRWERAEEVLDRRTGIIATVIAQAHFKGKFKPEDFMPHKRKKQSVEEMTAILSSIAVPERKK